MPPPSSLPQWDSNLTNTVPLVSSHKTDGLVTNEVPSSAEFNTWMNLVYQWVKYLSSGFNLVPTSVSLTNAQHDNLDVSSGAGSLDNIPLVVFTGGGSSTVITGITNGSSGRVLVLENGSSADIQLQLNSSSSSAGNDIAVNDGISNSNIRFPHNGMVALWHNGTQWFLMWSSFPIDTAPTEVLVIPAATGKIDLASVDTFAGGTQTWNLVDSSGFGGVWYPIELPAGAVLLTYKFYANKASGNTKTVTAKIIEFNSDRTGNTTLDTQTNTTAAPGAITLKHTGLNHTVVVGKCLMGFIHSDSGSSPIDQSYDLEISFTRRFMPAPTIYTP